MSEQQPPNDDDDKPTVIRTRSTQATGSVHTPTIATQRTESTPTPHAHGDDTLALPIGTRLGEFELTQRIGEGGFGIVYLGWDHTLERKVALKEYLPSSIATRVGKTHISVRSERHRETFEAGLKSFINEAKLLARFDHPSLVKVYRFWEAHGTAYMVMPFYEGTTMRDTVRALAQPPDERWLIEMLAALTEALAVIHAEQCYHRDIAPDNVMLLHGSGRPLLLDFGAARRVIGDMTQALTVILKPGYAPVEQYAEVPGMKQGPWTDVYALAAVVYWCITSKTPPPSVGRMLHDSWVPLVEAGAGRYSAAFLEAIDRALAVRPEQRTQNIDALRHELGLPPAHVPGAPSAPRIDPDATVIRPARTTTGTAARTAVPTAAPAPPPRTAPVLPKTVAPTEVPAPGAAAATPARAPAPRRTGLIAALGLGVLVVGGGGWWLARGPATPVPPVAAPAPVATATPAPAPPAAAAPAAAPTPPPPAPPPAAPPRPLPRSPAEAFALWQGQRSAALQPVLRAPAAVKAGEQGKARIGVTSPQAGYVHLVAARAGGNDLQLWHPGAGAAAQRIAAGATLEIAPLAWATKPPAEGRWQVMAIVTREPWNLAADGWQAQGGLLVRSFDVAAAPAGMECPPGSGPCGAFGADEFVLEVTAPVAAAATAVPPPERKPPRAAPAPAPAGATGQNAEECARIISQMSLGDSSAALAARFKALGCR